MNIGTTNIERKTSSGIKGVSLNILSLYSQNTLDTHGKNIREEGKYSYEQKFIKHIKLFRS